MATCNESLLADEISVLQSIYLPSELEIKKLGTRSTEVVIMLHPYTADNDDEKYVCMQLIINLDHKYPNSKPLFNIKMPRGISDAQVDSILSNLDGLASHRTGEEMLFELIEYAKECLTNNNRPECPCAICLELFEGDDNFTRTGCFHFFHDACMARYTNSYVEEEDGDNTNPNRLEQKREEKKNVIPCPVCRADVDKSQLKTDCVAPDPQSTEEFVFQPSAKFLAWRKKMEAVFRRQQKRGGIIDIEAEKKKFLIQTRKTEGTEKAEKRNDDQIMDNNRSAIITSIDHWTCLNDDLNNRRGPDQSRAEPAKIDAPFSLHRKPIDDSRNQRSRNVPRKEFGGSDLPKISRRKERNDFDKDRQQPFYHERLKDKENVLRENVTQQKQRIPRGDSRQVKSDSSRSKIESVKKRTNSPIAKSDSPKSMPKSEVKPPPGFKPIV